MRDLNIVNIRDKESPQWADQETTLINERKHWVMEIKQKGKAMI